MGCAYAVLGACAPFSVHTHTGRPHQRRQTAQHARSVCWLAENGDDADHALGEEHSLVMQAHHVNAEVQCTSARLHPCTHPKNSHARTQTLTTHNQPWRPLFDACASLVIGLLPILATLMGFHCRRRYRDGQRSWNRLPLIAHELQHHVGLFERESASAPILPVIAVIVRHGCRLTLGDCGDRFERCLKILFFEKTIFQTSSDLRPPLFSARSQIKSKQDIFCSY
jgi:hypothetical protein